MATLSTIPQTTASDHARRSRRSTPTQTRYAHVGWTGSHTDKARLEIVAQWMTDHPYPPTCAVRSNPRIDVKFDLSYEGDRHPLYGADFLTDSRRFHIVVLHYLFAGWTEAEELTKATLLEGLPDFAVARLRSSSHHAPDAWRRRLRATGAHRVCAFGGADEVASTFLAEIPGYNKRVTSFGAVFDKLPTTRPTLRS
jgi:hypothetical protein